MRYTYAVPSTEFRADLAKDADEELECWMITMSQSSYLVVIVSALVIVDVESEWLKSRALK
jgi:hypothetical protein